MINKNMPAEEFEQLMAPLYRQLAGYKKPAECAEDLMDRYRHLGHFPPAALAQAVDNALATWDRSYLPPIAMMRADCEGWMRSRLGGIIPPKIRSEQCSFCMAERGIYDNGRIGVVHERSCRLFDPAVRSFPVARPEVA